MKQNIEILIDNEPLDLSDKQIVFDFVLFNPESPESAGYTRSYTITIPATQKNNRLLRNTNKVNVVSSYIHQTIPCIVKLYGVQLASTSGLLVTKTSEQGYDCNIILGKSQIADAIADKTLQDLNLGQTTYRYSNMNLTDTTLDYINAIFWLSNLGAVAWSDLLYSWKVRALFVKIFQEAGYNITGGYPPEMDWTQETYVVPSAEKFDFEEQFEANAQANYTGVLKRTTPLTVPANTTQVVTFDTIIGNPAFFHSNRFEPLTKVCYRLRLRAKRNSGIGTIALAVSTNNINPIPTATALHTTILLGPGIDEADFQIPFAGGLNLLGNVFVVIANLSNTVAFGLSEISLEVSPLYFILEGLYQYNFAANLPAVSQRDFIKNVLFLSGCIFNVNLFQNEISLLSINSILTQNAKDWTDKVDWSNSAVQELITQLARKTRVQFKDTQEGSFSFQIMNPIANAEKSISIQAKKANNISAILNIPIPKVLRTEYYEYPNSNLVAHPQMTSSETDNITPQFLNKPKRKGGDLIFATLSVGGGVVAREPFQNNKDRLIEGSFFGNAIERFNHYTLPANSYRLVGVDDLSAFSPNFAYTQKLYNQYRKVVFQAYLDIVDILNLKLDKPIFIGGGINRRFLLTAVRGWSSATEPCKLELLLIDEN